MVPDLSAAPLALRRNAGSPLGEHRAHSLRRDALALGRGCQGPADLRQAREAGLDLALEIGEAGLAQELARVPVRYCNSRSPAATSARHISGSWTRPPRGEGLAADIARDVVGTRPTSRHNPQVLDPMFPQDETARFDAGDCHGNVMGGKHETLYLAENQVLDYLHWELPYCETAVGGQLTYFCAFLRLVFSERCARMRSPPGIGKRRRRDVRTSQKTAAGIRRPELRYDQRERKLQQDPRARRNLFGYAPAHRCGASLPARLTLRHGAGTEFGRKHGFARIRSAADYQRQAPIRQWVDLDPMSMRDRGPPRGADHEGSLP